MKAAEWIDQVKVANGWESDYRAAKELGLSRNSISGYRTAVRTFDDDTAVKVAEALGLEAEIVLLDQFTERTKSEPARVSLAALLERLTKGKGPKRPQAGGGSAAVDISSVTSPTVPVGTLHTGVTHKVRGPKACARNTHCLNYESDDFTLPAFQRLQQFFATVVSYVQPPRLA